MELTCRIFLFAENKDVINRHPGLVDVVYNYSIATKLVDAVDRSVGLCDEVEFVGKNIHRMRMEMNIC